MKKVFTNWWTLSVLIAVVAALLLCLGLPIFVGALRPTWVRVTCCLVVAGVWGLIAFLRARKARKAADAIAAELAGPNAGDEESRALAARMADAMATLRSSAGRKRDYLYTKPWYVIIGPPGAGKTTALVNSGLRFPVGDQALKGVGGTRNLDFWFADEAAMVDTAGRYTTQDSDQAVDSRGWTSFLSLLKKHRPLQPINGIIVAIGVDELIRADCRRIDEHAAAVRRRLVELRRTLEVAAPVYVLLTKADLLAGFVEYYDDLDVEGRRAVLGSTLPFGGGKPTSDGLARAFDEMAQAVADRQAKRLFEEVDAHRRSMLLGFPSQLQSLRSRLMRFLDGAFVAGDEAGGVLRGFYLTSGVQQGAPLDRILSGMADVYDRPAASAGGSGRAYFLNRLLTDVMFPEAGLVATDPRAKARQRTQLVGAMAAIAAVSVVTLGAWGVSFARNRAFQNELLARADTAETALRESGVDLKEVAESDADLRAALPGLNALRGLPQGYVDRRNGGPPLTMRLGLFQSGLSAEADQTYREALRRVLLPRLLLRLEQVMQASASDPLRLYEPLKVYLMLGSQGPLDRAAVRSFVTNDWATEVYPGADAQLERNQLGQHLQALLNDPDMAASWTDRRAPLDGTLIASARAAVGTLSLADRAYAVMRQKAQTAGPAWEVANVISQGDALAFTNPDGVLSARIPYFFTRTGFEKVYTPGLLTVQQDLKKDLWVLGGDADTAGVQGEMQNVRAGVAGLYAKDYIAAWEGVVKTMQPASYFTDRAALGAFTKMPSPLKLVLLELRKNTIFAGGLANGVGAMVNRRLSTAQVRGVTARDLSEGRATGLSAGDEITNYFAQLQAFVGDGKAPAPIDDFVAAVKAAGQAVIAAKSMGGGGGSDATQAQMATAMAQVQTAAAGAPAQLAPFVEAAAKGGSGAQVSAAQGAVTDAYAQSVMPACKGVAQERYPFFGGAVQDASVPDTLRLFGMGGTLDGFTQVRLMPLMDTAGPVWRWKSDDPVAQTLDPLVPEEFAKAAEIRDLLAGGLPLKVSVAAMGADVASADFSAGGQTYKFARGDAADKPLLWSATGGTPSAGVVLYSADNQEARRYEAEGPWALFRLIDKAVRENSGAQAFKATFGEGGRSVSFLIKLPTEKNPFSRGGVWSFRCPNAL